MSSPAPDYHSSQFSITSPRRIPKSKFTYKQLHQLKSYSPQTPLRVIAHVDLDAFYAQCETVRLGIDPTKPLAVQQWQGLIAINVGNPDVRTACETYTDFVHQHLVPRPRIRPQSPRNLYRSAETMSRSYTTARRDVEGGRRDMGVS
jgi:hypothetical protein